VWKVNVKAGARSSIRKKYARKLFFGVVTIPWIVTCGLYLEYTYSGIVVIEFGP